MSLLNIFKKKQTQAPTKAEPLKTDFKRLKLLVTVVNRKKTEFYMDYLTSLGINFQTSMAGHGTASSDTMYLLGLENSDKGVIFSVLREDLVPVALQGLEEKFHTIRNGKGIAFVTPMSSIIGVAIYRFLCDHRAK